jgi:hypothetical protein
VHRRAVHKILAEGTYTILNRFRLELKLHNPDHQVSLKHRSSIRK